MGLLNLANLTSLAYFGTAEAVPNISIAQERWASFNEGMICSSADAEDAFKSLEPSCIEKFLHFNLIAPSLSRVVNDEARIPFVWLVNCIQSKDSYCLDEADT